MEEKILTDKLLRNQMDSGETYYETSELKKEQAFYRDLLFQFNHTLPSKTQKRGHF